MTTKIQYAEHTWNPFHAGSEYDSQGWACIKYAPGCVNCYAERLNAEKGTGFPYTRDGLEQLAKSGGKVWLKYDLRSTTSICWPLRMHTPSTIFPCSMTDWMGEFIPQNWQSFMLSVMLLARDHVFITWTKRYKNLVAMIHAIDVAPNRTIVVPADKPFTSALVKANAMKKDIDEYVTIEADPNTAQTRPSRTLSPFQQSANIPWPPENILFGVSVSTQREANTISPLLYNMKARWPSVRIALSCEPALEVIDWREADLQRGVIEWMVWGGESGPDARPADITGWYETKEFCETNGIKKFFKQTGSVLAAKWGLKDSKGGDIKEEKLAAMVGGSEEEVRETIR